MLCRRNVRLILLFSWILPVVCGLPYLFYTRVVKLNGPVFCRTVWSKSLNAIYIGVGFVIFYCGPLLAIIIFYTLTIKTLRKRPVALEENLPSKIYDKRKKQNEKVIKFVIIIVAGFFVCWTPLIVYLALKMFHPELFPKDVCLIFVGALFYVLPSLSTAINPVILLLLSSNYRRALNDLILWKKSWKAVCHICQEGGRAHRRTIPFPMNRDCRTTVLRKSKIRKEREWHIETDSWQILVFVASVWVL